MISIDFRRVAFIYFITFPQLFFSSKNIGFSRLFFAILQQNREAATKNFHL
jgi:hypothetical protein